MATLLNQPELTVTVSDLDLVASDGSVSLDYSRIPFGVADIDVPLTDPAVVAALDPRTAPRVILTGRAAGSFITVPDVITEDGETIPGGSAWTWEDTRTLDFHLRDVVVDHSAKTVRLSAATDEALLIDYTPLADTDLLDYSSSLRGLVNHIIDTVIPGRTLEPGADVGVPPIWSTENIAGNPYASGNTNGWEFSAEGGSGGTGTITRVTGLTGTPRSVGFRVTRTAGTGWWCIADSRDNAATVSPGEWINLSAYVRASSARNLSIIIDWLEEVDGVKVFRSQTAKSHAVGTSFSRISVTGLAPVNATHFQMIVRDFSTGPWFEVTAWQATREPYLAPYFDGGSTLTSTYSYRWNGTPNAPDATSDRVALVDERPPDALRWEIGTSAWDYLENLASSVGRRLYCDEQRRWWLIDPEQFLADGLLTLGVQNSTAGTDTLSRDAEDTWATGIAVRYSWRDARGIDKVAWDRAGVAGKVRIIERAMPYPGPGFAAAALLRITGQGRIQDVTTLADYRATPGQEASISLPGAPDQVGQVTGIEWLASTGLMNVRTKALTVAVPGSYLAYPTTTYDETPDSVLYSTL